MEYSINKLAKLAGVSTRTLRYYDQCGLLVPQRVRSGYRVYGRAEADRLQQILFYRELGMPLGEIKRILSAPGFDAGAALRGHLAALAAKRDRLDALIRNVEKTIQNQKGEIMMDDQEKFEGFKQQLIDDNEASYGKEIRERYGEEAVERSNARIRGMPPEQYAESERLANAYQAALKDAFGQGDPAGALAQEACDLHRQWLCCFWDHYSKEAHLGAAQLYVDDPRFGEYYDKIAPGCAAFLRDAVAIYCQ